MSVVGLITEYNPFHNGHKHHIEEAKKVTGAEYAVAVMSGNFVQRGTPALIDKYSRAEMALKNGADLVLELPVCYATGSAEFFANGAVSLLDKLGIVDYLCFGSECGDIGLLSTAANAIRNTADGFDEELLSSLKDGLTYPAARLRALEHTLNISTASKDVPKLSAVLKEPNNILGIEYLKAIGNLSSGMLPVTIQRQKAHYHTKKLTDSSTVPVYCPNAELSEEDKSSGKLSKEISASEIGTGCSSMLSAAGILPGGPVISSATAIRNALSDPTISPEDRTIASVKNSVPENVYDLLRACYLKKYPVTEEDFSQIIKYKLMAEDNLSLTRYVDITSDLADRMKNLSGYDTGITELAKKIKTRNMTLTRINRALIHMLLNIREDDFTQFNRNGYCAYARVLGMKKESSHLLRKITELGRIPVITKVAKAQKQLDGLGAKMLSGDIFAAHIYNQAVFEKYHTVIPNEYKHGICMI